MERGKFIVLEGLDGCGKSTAAGLLAERIRKERPQSDPYMTWEPSEGEVGRLIRRALSREIVLRPETFALLFAADRNEHVQNEILPALYKGRDVLCDRYYFSNLAYQGDVTPRDMILSFNQLARQAVTPDIVFFVDTPPEECMRRIRQNRCEEELFEQIEKLKNVEKLYKGAFDFLSETEHVVRIDGTLSPDEVAEEMYKNL